MTDREPGSDDRFDDQDVIDRAFADLIAHWADGPVQGRDTAADAGGDSRDHPDEGPVLGDRSVADLVRDVLGTDPAALPPTRQPAPPPVDREERYTPPPVGWPRPSVPVLLGWTGITIAVVIMLLAAFGVGLPTWAGWLAVLAFAIGFGILLSRLPRRRPPDSGDGAVL